MNTVDYMVTGFTNNLLLVRFTLGNQTENLTFAYDGRVPIKEFLDQQAVFVVPSLKRKAEAVQLDLLQFVGTSGTVDVPDLPPPPPAPPPMYDPLAHARMEAERALTKPDA